MYKSAQISIPDLFMPNREAVKGSDITRFVNFKSDPKSLYYI